jgi:hypothetical protein
MKKYPVMILKVNTDKSEPKPKPKPPLQPTIIKNIKENFRNQTKLYEFSGGGPPSITVPDPIDGKLTIGDDVGVGPNVYMVPDKIIENLSNIAILNTGIWNWKETDEYTKKDDSYKNVPILIH